jgi:hypothetical protein
VKEEASIMMEEMVAGELAAGKRAMAGKEAVGVEMVPAVGRLSMTTVDKTRRIRLFEALPLPLPSPFLCVGIILIGRKLPIIVTTNSNIRLQPL